MTSKKVPTSHSAMTQSGVERGMTPLWQVQLADQILALAWSSDGEFLASFDRSGNVTIWLKNGTQHYILNLGHQYHERAAHHREESGAIDGYLLWSDSCDLLVVACFNILCRIYLRKQILHHIDYLDRHVLPLFIEKNHLTYYNGFRISQVLIEPSSNQMTKKIFSDISLFPPPDVLGQNNKIFFMLNPNDKQYYQMLRNGLPVRIFREQSSFFRASQILEYKNTKSETEALLTAEYGGNISLRDRETGACRRILEGHRTPVIQMSISSDQKILISEEENGILIIWSLINWESLLEIQILRKKKIIAYHPTDDMIAISELQKKEITAWSLDRQLLLGSQSKGRDVHYRNAKIVLVGDSGVGKTGLGLVLAGQPYRSTDSSHGRFIWNLGSESVNLNSDIKEARETLLWDLAGQPGYRLIHQLHLNDVAVALVIFDAKSETDPFSGVGHWAKALQTAIRVQGKSAPPMKRYLVAARSDRGRVAASRQRIDQTMADYSFDGFFETSAREGYQISELRTALRDAIPWDFLPQVSSTQLFKSIKDFLLAQKQAGQLLSAEEDLFLRFKRQPASDTATREDFHSCLVRLESSGLVRCLSFGALVLLQPELLDAYASAIVNEARAEPDGLGSIAESKVLRGEFSLSDDERLSNAERERLLLNATVEDMVRYEIALRESEQDGAQLVFPSQLTRENPDLPDPPGKATVLIFDGPTHNIYATLVVRLSHSHAFRKHELWRNAVQFQALPGGRCGLAMRDFDGHAELTIFYDTDVGKESRMLFEDYVEKHVSARALPGSVHKQSVLSCLECGQEFPPSSVRNRLADPDKIDIGCSNCDRRMPLRAMPVSEATSEAIDRERRAMDASADRARDREVSLLSVIAELTTPDFLQWQGDASQLALVFTRPAWESESQQRFLRSSIVYPFVSRETNLLKSHRGRGLKVINETCIYGFRALADALAFARRIVEQSSESGMETRVIVHVAFTKEDRPESCQALVRKAAQLESKSDEPGLFLSEEAEAMAVQTIKDDPPSASPSVTPQAMTAEGLRLELALRCDRGANLNTQSLTEQFGGKVTVRPRPSPGRIKLDWNGACVDALLAAAERGTLDAIVQPYGIHYCESVRAEGEWLYEHLPERTFSRPALRHVSAAELAKHRNAIDLAILTTTTIEREAVLSIFKPLPGEERILEGSMSSGTYRLGSFGCYRAVHFESSMGTQSRDGALLTVSEAISEWQPKATIVIGIAFGINRKKQRLGDVLIADSVAPYELQRVGDKGTIHRGQPIPCGTVLSERFRSRRTDWQKRQSGRHVHVFQGLLLSGEKLIDNKEFRDELLTGYPTALGGEMEGIGAYAAAQRHSKEIILVKSICDWADGHKNDRAQAFASFTAVSLAYHVLSKPGVLEALSATDI